MFLLGLLACLLVSWTFFRGRRRGGDASAAAPPPRPVRHHRRRERRRRDMPPLCSSYPHATSWAARPAAGKTEATKSLPIPFPISLAQKIEESYRPTLAPQVPCPVHGKHEQ